MNTFPETIYEYIKQEETAYETSEVEIFDNYSWNMSQHIQMCLSMKLGKFLQASNDPKVKPPKKNIVITNLRLRFRSQDIDVKDVLLEVDNPDLYHLSFLVKKYHDDVFVVENDLDSFFDKANEEEITLGGVLAKKGETALPEVIPLQSLAFCDQTDILGSPIAFKLNYSPDKLRQEEERGWGDEKNGATISIEDLIDLARREKEPAGSITTKANKTPGANIEVYIVRGQMPEKYLKEGGKDDLEDQVEVVAFYRDKKDNKQGVTLYRQKEVEDVYKFYSSEPVFNRALGVGGAEEIFDAQIWTDFLEIHKMNMLKASSKNVIWTTDESYAKKNKVKDLSNNELTVLADGKQMGRVPTENINIQLFTQAIQELDIYAKEIGGATDPMLGKEPASGSPFRLQALLINQGQKMPEYRRGKFAKFVEEIYKDWILPHIIKEITKGQQFLSELSYDEMQYVADCVVRNQANNYIKEEILSGRLVEQTAIEAYKEKVREEFMRGGNKRFLKILKGELRGVALKVKVNVAGKQKDMLGLVDKYSNLLKFIMSTYNPQTGTFAAYEDPRIAKILNQMEEASGISPAQFYQEPKAPPMPQMSTISA